MSPSRITEITQGRRGITTDTALRLDRWLGTGSEIWMNLQKTYGLRAAEQQHGAEIEREVIPRHGMPPVSTKPMGKS